MTHIHGCRPRIADIRFKIPPGRPKARVALFEIVAEHGLDIFICAAGDQTVTNLVITQRGPVLPPVPRRKQRQPDLPDQRLLVEARSINVDSRADPVAGLVFEDGHDAVPFQRTRLGKGIAPCQEKCAVCLGGRVISPQIDDFALARRGDAGIAQRPSKRSVFILIGVGQAVAQSAVADVGVERIELGPFVAHIRREGALAVLKRADGAHVHRAGQPLAGQPRLGRLVDHHGLKQFRGVLIELDTAVVAGAHLLAAVQERCGEIGRQAANADDLLAAVQPLPRQARQTCQGFGDTVVGKLADVFGGYRLHDQVRIPLELHGVHETLAEAGHDDLFDHLFVRRRLRVLGFLCHDVPGHRAHGGCHRQ